MSKTVHIGSSSQFTSLLQSSKIVVTDCMSGLRHAPLACFPLPRRLVSTSNWLIRNLTVYADWCGPCKQIAPIYEQLSAQLSRPGKITFAKVDTDKQKEVAQTYGVTA